MKSFSYGEDDSGTEILDRAIELLESIEFCPPHPPNERLVREAYLTRTVANMLSKKIAPTGITVESVGSRPAMDALYFAWLPSCM